MGGVPASNLAGRGAVVKLSNRTSAIMLPPPCDVFVVRDDVLKERPGQVLAMIKAWNDAVQAYNADVPGGRAIISKAVGAEPADLNTAFDGVKYYSLEDNKAQLTGDYTTKVFVDVEQAAKNAKLLTSDVKAEDMIDPSFVQAAQ